MSGSQVMSGPQPSAARGSRDGAALTLLCCVQLLLLLDFSIVNVALPDIAGDLGLDEQRLQWVVSAYALSFGGLLLLGGQLADLYGRRRCFVIGLAVFSLTSLVGALAQDGGMLLAMRAMQGVAAALVAPALLSLITTRFPEGAARNRALGFFGAAGASGFAVGVLFGGLLVQALGWRSVFMVNVPLMAAAVAAALILLEETALPPADRRLDVVGAVVGTAGLTSLLFGVTELPRGLGQARTLVPMVVGVALLLVFARHERRTPQPLLPPRMMRQRALAAANVLNLLVPGVVGAAVLLISIQLQSVRGDSALATGMSLLPLGVIIMIAAPASALLSTRIGPKPVLAVGISVAAVGVALCAFISASSPYVSVALPGLLLLGIGFAAYVTTTTIAGTGSVADEQQGLASGLLNATLQVGTAIGVAVLTTVAAAHVGRSAGSDATPTDGFRIAMLVGAAITAVAAAIAVAVFPNRRTASAPSSGP